MRKAQVFRFIWRANAVIILAGGLCALVLVGILAVTQLRWMFRERHVDAVVNTDVSGNVKEKLVLGGATRIIGQPWLLVRLTFGSELRARVLFEIGSGGAQLRLRRASGADALVV